MRVSCGSSSSSLLERTASTTPAVIGFGTDREPGFERAPDETPIPRATVIAGSAICSGFERRLSPVMRQHHVAGDKAFVDYSGKRIGLADPLTGEIR